MRELFTSTLMCVIGLTCILIFGNLTKYEESLLIALEHSPLSFCKLIGLLLPYVLSMSIPFGFSLALSWVLAKWSNFREIDALKSLGISSWRLSLPILSFSVPLCIVVLYASLQWGPVNRKKFDDFRHDLAWSNLSKLMAQEGEISFSTAKGEGFSGKESLGSLAGLPGEEISTITVSAMDMEKDNWRDIRMCLHNSNQQVLAVINAGMAKVEREEELGKVFFHLYDIDLEPSYRGEDFFSGAESIFVKIKKLKEPLVFNLSPDQPESLKRMGFVRLYQIAINPVIGNQSKQARDIIGKNIALGFSPLFICLFLIPAATIFGKNDPSLGLIVGIVICTSYFIIGSTGQNLLAMTDYGWIGWWIPNFLCLFYIFFKLLKQGNSLVK
jgi:lipopolysaccharide export system permease protein